MWDPILPKQAAVPRAVTSHRLKTPEGWVIRSMLVGSRGAAVAQTTVTDPDHYWLVEEWQFVQTYGHTPGQHDSHRLKVPGGWILRTVVQTGQMVSIDQLLIADPLHTWDLNDRGSTQPPPIPTQP